MPDNLPVIEGESSNELALTPEMQALIDSAADEQSASETNGIPFISTKGKKFANGDTKLGTSLNVVLLASVFDHSYYDRPYDEDVITPPACFAIGKTEEDMAPHEDSPVPQSDTCEHCAMNEFGSSANGKGKACRNGRRFLMAPVYSDGRIDLNDLAIVNISPTALKGFSKYIKAISSMKRLPLWAVVTTLSFDEDAAYPVVIPSYDSLVPPAVLKDIAPRLQEFEEYVSVAYDTSTYEPPEVAEQQTKKKSKMS